MIQYYNTKTKSSSACQQCCGVSCAKSDLPVEELHLQVSKSYQEYNHHLDIHNINTRNHLFPFVLVQQQVRNLTFFCC